MALIADTTVEDEVERALDTFAAATGAASPDGLVANAGIVRFGPLATISAEDWRTVVDVNLTGTFLSARAVARRMIAAGTGGSLVTVTSMNGVAPGPNAGAYGATKAAVALLTRQMALEWGPNGIRANAVAPGLIDAGMSEPIYADDDIRRRRARACRSVGSAPPRTSPARCCSCCPTRPRTSAASSCWSTAVSPRASSAPCPGRSAVDAVGPTDEV